MASILESITSIFTAAIGWVGTVGNTIMGASTSAEGVTTYSPGILFLFCVIPLIGLGVGLFRRLINVN